MTQHRSELLMPAGNLRKLKMAILYGADAVYLAQQARSCMFDRFIEQMVYVSHF